MKRADISPGEYAVRRAGKVQRHTVVTTYRTDNGYRSVDRALLFNGQNVSLPQVLMPWPQWLEQQEANKARTRDIDRQRQEYDELSFVELRARLATHGVAIREWNEDLRLVTLRVEDLARLLGAGR